MSRQPLGYLGRYELLFRVAAGGMAEVYAARDTTGVGVRKLYAVKRILPHLAEDELFITMLVDEGCLAAHITSPHVVQTYDLARHDDDSLYIVMEFVRGVSLRHLLGLVHKSDARMPVSIATSIVHQIARGLHDAHEARQPTGEPLGIIHRDVSPHNILIGVDGRARITDFGVARALQRRTITSAGQLKGKIGYLAPEQVSGTVDRRADIFALGIVAWELFTGERLFKAETSNELLNQVRNKEIPSITEVRSDLPKAITAPIDKALSRSPDERHDTALELATELFTADVMATTEAFSTYVKELAEEELTRIEQGIESGLTRDLEPRSSENSITHSTVVSRRFGQEEPNPFAHEFEKDEPTQSLKALKQRDSPRKARVLLLFTLVLAIAIAVGVAFNYFG